MICFGITTIDSLTETFHFFHSLFYETDKDSDKVGSVSICEMLDRTNLIAIVAGGNYPIIAPNSGNS